MYLLPVPDVDPPRFRQLLGRFATGVAVITARTPDGRDVGMTASSLSSISLVPPLVGVSVDREADLHAVLHAAPRWAVNILAADQEELSRRFAIRGPERFDGIGAFRTMENDASIDISGAMDGVSFQGAAGLGKAMAASPETSYCVAGRALEYATARPPDDNVSLVETLDKQFAADGYNIRALFLRVATLPQSYQVKSEPVDGGKTNLTMASK